MKAIGIVRKTDTLGRIVIPRVSRKSLDVNESDSMEIFVDDDMVILQKYKTYAECIINGHVSKRGQIAYLPSL